MPARASPTIPGSTCASSLSCTYPCALCPLPVTRRPSTSKERSHGAPEVIRAVSAPVSSTPPDSSRDAFPAPVAPGSSNPPCQAPPSWWAMRTRTTPSIGEDRVVVSTARLSVSPRLAMRAVGAVTTNPSPSAVSAVCQMSYASWAYRAVTPGRSCQNPSVNFTRYSCRWVSSGEGEGGGGPRSPHGRAHQLPRDDCRARS